MFRHDVHLPGPVKPVVDGAELTLRVAELPDDVDESELRDKAAKYGLEDEIDALLWVTGVPSGASSVADASLPVQLVLMVLSLAIVVGFGYTVYSVVRYRCGARRGRAVRAMSVLLLSRWGWIGVFRLP